MAGIDLFSIWITLFGLKGALLTLDHTFWDGKCDLCSLILGNQISKKVVSIAIGSCDLQKRPKSM